MVPMTFADKALSKASDEVQADNLSTMVLYVCHCIQFLIEKIRALDKYKDNKDELFSIHKDVERLLNTDFVGMDIFYEVIK